MKIHEIVTEISDENLTMATLRSDLVTKFERRYQIVSELRRSIEQEEIPYQMIDEAEERLEELENNLITDIDIFRNYDFDFSDDSLQADFDRNEKMKQEILGNRN